MWLRKSDLTKLQETVSSHALEIKQLREDLVTQSKRIQNLEDSVGSQAAKTFTRTQPDVSYARPIQHGGPLFQNIQVDERQRNLVFEGIPALSEPELESFILQLCSALSIITFPSDLEGFVPMKRRDPTSLRPPPILVTFNQNHVRSALLRQKYKLAEMEKYREVYINPDELIEVRRTKATFRKIAYNARQDGKTVTFRSDWIQIDGTTYYVPDIDKIPDTYKVNMGRPKTDKPPGGAMGGVGSTPEQDSLLPQEKTRNDPETTTREKPSTNERIKLTRAGYTYAGESAYLSHFYNCEFTYRKIQYTSVEQGLHHIHATHENNTEMAKIIMSRYYARDIKTAAKDLPNSEEWNNMSPGVLAELNKAKFDQNPDLKRRLIDTAPHKLVEATVDAKWGGACPYGSEIYEQGQVPGRNIAGEQLTKQRDNMISKMDEIRMI